MEKFIRSNLFFLVVPCSIEYSWDS